MMISPLQLTGKISLPEGILAKPSSEDSANVPSMSFGEILRAEEKQLQQEMEINAASITAALAAARTILSNIISVSVIETDGLGETTKGDLQSATRAISAPTGSAPIITGLNGVDAKAGAHAPMVEPPQVESFAPVVSTEMDSLTAKLPSTLPETQAVTETGKVVSRTPDGVKTTNTTLFQASPDLLPEESAMVREGTAAGTKTVERRALPAKPVSEAPQAADKSVAEAEVPSSTVITSNQRAEPFNVSLSQLPPADLPAQAETDQEKPVFETKTDRVDTPVRTANVPQSEASAEGKTETPATSAFTPVSSLPGESSVGTLANAGTGKVLAQPIFQAEASDVQAAESGLEILSPKVAKSQKKTVIEVKTVENQPAVPVSQITGNLVENATAVANDAESMAPRVKTSLSLSESKTSASLINADFEIEHVVKQNAQLEQETDAPSLEFAKRVATTRIGTDQGAKKAGIQVNATEPSADKALVEDGDMPIVGTLPTDARTDNERGKVLTQPIANTEKSATPADQKTSESLPIRFGASPEKVVSEANKIDNQTGVPTPVSETLRPAEASLFTNEVLRAAMFSPHISVAGEAKNVMTQPADQTEAPTTIPTRPPLDTSPISTNVDSKKADAKTELVEIQAGTNTPSIEIPRSGSEFPINEMVSAYTGTDNGIAQTVTLAEVTITSSALDLPEGLPAKSGTSQEKMIAEPKSVEKHVSMEVPATVVSQVTTKSAEKTEAITAAAANLNTNSQRVISADSNQKFDDGQTLPVNNSEAIINKAPLPVSVASDKATVPSFETFVSVNVEPGKEDLKIRQTISAEEKTILVEKEQEPNRMLESMPVTTNPVKQTMEVGVPEKGPAAQINNQAAEVVQQIMHQMNVRLQSGPTSMRLQLNPKELGAIDVKMISNSQGVSVTFFAEQASTGRLLETQLNQLRQSLMESGVQLSGLNISQHGQPRQEGGFLNQNTDFAQHSQRDTAPSEANIKERLHTKRITGQSSEIDYLI